jgi:hypothetical protein
MNKQTTRTRSLLLLLGIVVMALLSLPDLARRVFADASTQGLAFQSAPETPTVTPTWTPFFFTPSPQASLFTPTPTLDLRVVNEIVHPQDGDAAFGFAPLVGSAIIRDFDRYDVHIAVTGSENWTWLTSNREVVRNGVLYVLNTYEFDDGFYDLRVRAIDRRGNFTEAFLRKLEIRNAAPPTITPFPTSDGINQPLSPLIVFETPSPTVTPTPRFRSFIPNSQGIFEPQNGDVIRAQTAVIGTVNGKTALNPFERYELFITPSGLDQWGWLYSSTEQFWQSEIYSLDTTALEDGFYDLRLRIVYRDSNYDEYYVTRLRVANHSSAPASHPTATRSAAKSPGLYFPFDNIRVTGVVDFVGTTATPNLLRWELYWAPSGSDQWTFLFSDAKPIVNSYLARLDLGLLPEDSYDFRLRIVRQDYTYSDYYVREVVAVPPTPTPIPQPPGR